MAAEPEKLAPSEALAIVPEVLPQRVYCGALGNLGRFFLLSALSAPSSSTSNRATMPGRRFVLGHGAQVTSGRRSDGPRQGSEDLPGLADSTGSGPVPGSDIPTD